MMENESAKAKRQGETSVLGNKAGKKNTSHIIVISYPVIPVFAETRWLLFKEATPAAVPEPTTRSRTLK